jgi:hypothetical protein
MAQGAERVSEAAWRAKRAWAWTLHDANARHAEALGQPRQAAFRARGSLTLEGALISPRKWSAEGGEQAGARVGSSRTP